MTPTNADLHKFLISRYDLEGLKTLCVYLDIEPDSLDHRTRDVLARELILHMTRINRRPELVDLQAQTESALARRRSPHSRSTVAQNARRVFISHAHQDAALAHRLAADLEKAGWLVWIAPESIQPGEQWLPAIARGLQESGVCVVIMTPDGVASPWVEYETNLAISRERRGLMRLLLLDVAACDVPFGWTGYQYSPFRGDYETGLNGLLRWLEGEPEAKIRGDLAAHTDTSVETGRRAVSSEPPAERRVKEEQWRQLQVLARDIAAVLGRQSGDDELREVYRQFNRKFGLRSYKQLPRRQFAEGLVFLTTWRDEVVALQKTSLKDELAVSSDTALPGTAIFSPPGFRLHSVDSIVHKRTRMQFIRIPAGPFLYGDDKKPLELPEYWIGRTPVTNAQYKRFLDANPKHAAPDGWQGRDIPAGKADHPVIYVSWNDAQAFCNWAGLALPTEEQWEKAARGTDGRIWPWGNEEPTAEHCNFNKNVGTTTPVGRYSPKGDSPYGGVDMAGNVWEWTASWYDSSQRGRVLRGGSWGDDQGYARVSFRSGYAPGLAVNYLGFRAVAPVDSDS